MIVMSSVAPGQRCIGPAQGAGCAGRQLLLQQRLLLPELHGLRQAVAQHVPRHHHHCQGAAAPGHLQARDLQASVSILSMRCKQRCRSFTQWTSQPLPHALACFRRLRRFSRVSLLHAEQEFLILMCICSAMQAVLVDTPVSALSEPCLLPGWR